MALNAFKRWVVLSAESIKRNPIYWRLSVLKQKKSTTTKRRKVTSIIAMRKGHPAVTWEVGEEAALRLGKYQWKYTIKGATDGPGIPYCSHEDLVRKGANSRSLGQAILNTDNKVMRINHSKFDCSPDNLKESNHPVYRNARVLENQNESTSSHHSNGEIVVEQVKIWRARCGRKVLGHGKTRNEALINALEAAL